MNQGNGVWRKGFKMLLLCFGEKYVTETWISVDLLHYILLCPSFMLHKSQKAKQELFR